MKYEYLLTPDNIGSLKVKNRVIMAPMSVSLANKDGTVSDDLLAYYKARVDGGAGLIFTEYCYVQESGKSSESQISIASDDAIPGLRRVADIVHEGGAKICLQLQHGGRRSIVTLMAPSPIPMLLGDETPHAMTAGECYALIADFVKAAVRAQKAGYDMVEVHCSHGYLLGDFVSPRSNRRTDEFGGSAAGRAKIVTEIIKGIKLACGNDFPVSIRLSGDEFVTDGNKKRDAAELSLLFEAAGADLINVSGGVCGVGHGIAPAAREAGYNVDAANEIAKAVSIAVAVAGRINEPEYAEELLRTTAIRFVSIGRALFADPDFVKKAAAGREDEIAPCVGCLQRCYGHFYHGDDRKRSCMINPFAMRETRLVIKPAAKAKRITVVGAGPSGLEAAWLLAKRGHHVTLYDKNDMPGGQFRIAAVPPHKQLLTRAITYYDKMCQIYGVDCRYGTEVTKDMILAENPDTVILATGGTPFIPPIPGVKEANVLTGQEVLLGACLKGRKVLVIGGGAQGAETADHLGQYGYDVTVVEMRDGIALDDPEATRILLYERFRENNIKTLTGATVKRVYADGADCEMGGEMLTLRGFDHIVIAVGVRSFNPLEAELTDYNGELIVLGDAHKASDAVEAIYQGTITALKL